MVNFFYLDKDPKKCAEYYCNKHIIKIPIEIAQILSKLHYELKSNIDFSKIYKNSTVVKNSIGPYKWIKESYDNYIWTCKLGLELIKEYKLRYKKDKHKTEIVLNFLLNHPPNLKKKGITKFIGTNKYDMFQYISKNLVICARYNYAEMKCIGDKWNKDGPPDWFIKIKKSILIKKKNLINKIIHQVREKLPSFVSKGDKVFRFHSFLRICYDHLFQGKWNVKAEMMNKYNKKEALIHQLTFPQLYYIYKISKSLENKKILLKLNIESLRYRDKLKFPIQNIDYRKNPEYYIYNSKLIEVSDIQPYTNEIEENLNKCNDDKKNISKKLYNMFLKYIKNKDFIGADIIRKYIQMNKLDNILMLVINNKLYNDWITSFNWKIADPYRPNMIIIK